VHKIEPVRHRLLERATSARPAVIAADSVQPVPCVMFVSMRCA